MSLDDEADAVTAMVDGRSSPIQLVGHSYGGAIALRLALRWPSRFDTLTLIEPAVYPFLRHAGLDSLAADVEAVNDSFIERVRRNERQSAFESYYEYYNGGAGSWSQLDASVRAKLVSIAGTVATALAAVHASPTELSECSKVSMPTMMVRGSATDRVHSCLSELIAKEIPGAKLETIQGARHMLTLSHPSTLASLISKHIAAVPRWILS